MNKVRATLTPFHYLKSVSAAAFILPNNSQKSNVRQNVLQDVHSGFTAALAAGTEAAAAAASKLLCEDLTSIQTKATEGYRCFSLWTRGFSRVSEF